MTIVWCRASGGDNRLVCHDEHLLSDVVDCFMCRLLSCRLRCQFATGCRSSLTASGGYCCFVRHDNSPLDVVDCCMSVGGDVVRHDNSPADVVDCFRWRRWGTSTCWRAGCRRRAVCTRRASPWWRSICSTSPARSPSTAVPSRYIGTMCQTG